MTYATLRVSIFILNLSSEKTRNDQAQNSKFKLIEKKTKTTE